jgi:hypothetical protein
VAHQACSRWGRVAAGFVGPGRALGAFRAWRSARTKKLSLPIREPRGCQNPSPVERDSYCYVPSPAETGRVINASSTPNRVIAVILMGVTKPTPPLPNITPPNWLYPPPPTRRRRELRCCALNKLNKLNRRPLFNLIYLSKFVNAMPSHSVIAEAEGQLDLKGSNALVTSITSF